MEGEVVKIHSSPHISLKKNDGKESNIMRKKFVRSKRINTDVWFFHSIINEGGFLITEPPTISLDGKKEKTLYGPNSPLFGTSYEDVQAFMERNRCKCGAFKGKQFKGEICPFCGTKIESREVDIKKTGWISLGVNKIISPFYYKELSILIGKKVFPEIINEIERVDENGKRHKLVPGVDFEASSPYSSIGIDGLIEKFDEIMDYYMKKKPLKKKDFIKIKKEKANVFTSYIPIYSTFLRPQSVTSDTFYYNGIDKEINPLYNLSESLKHCEPIEKSDIQNRIQKHVNNMWDYNFDLLNTKDGFIRHKLIAGSLNYTSRAVIIPGPSLRTNEIILSYQAFRILFKYRIIYYIMKMKNIPLAKAYFIWKRAYKFDKYVYQIMQYIIKKDRPRILLNRNPTINYYSMLLLKIKDVNPDPYRTTLIVNMAILGGLNADFDGDQLNQIAIFEPELIRMFRKFDPVERYIMSRDKPEINHYFQLSKGDLIDLYYFATFKEEEGLENLEQEKLMDMVREMQKVEYKPKNPSKRDIEKIKDKIKAWFSGRKAS